MYHTLSKGERETLLEFGRRGSGGDFDQAMLSKLFAKELLEVRSTDRKLVLSDEGRELYAELRDND